MNTYEKIYEIVHSIPPGMVMSYGQIAAMLSGCTARMVGYAMAATPDDKEIAWWRVVNSQLKISLRASGGHDVLQRRLLEQEGVVFNKNGKIDPRYRHNPAEE